MSYTEDIRGCLAYVAGAGRRVMALRELGLPEADEKAIQDGLDEAADCLLKVVGILGRNGHHATGMGAVVAGATPASRDSDWRRQPETKQERTDRLMARASKPWKSVKEQAAEARAKKAAPADSATGLPSPTAGVTAPTEEFDAAHPWSTAERHKPTEGEAPY